MGNPLIIPRPKVLTLEDYRSYLRDIQDKGFIVNEYEHITDLFELDKIYINIKAKLYRLSGSNEILTSQEYDLRTN